MGTAQSHRARGASPEGALLPQRLTFHGLSRVPPNNIAKVFGYVEATDVLFVCTATRDGSVYMVQLDSGRVTKILDRCTCTCIFPYTSFCISGIS